MTSSVTLAPYARADDTVTYEVVTTSDIATANVEYNDLAGRQAQQQVPLPWRLNATVRNPLSNDAEVRADWRPVARPSKWVTVRVYYRGSLVCQNTLDVGNAACYGSTTFKPPPPRRAN
ncbi:hypothetical protein BST14_18970 [Mycobacterium arosiense ATCC BAA-1401 = DSM 45069]|uniref:Uncharacterized protein n=1 Tax=Mycobacterium arosiense ATCC BAA-1401 = DSM 45069 TaxID=1265311 RepID=A0A1W9ZBQ7_MYCAI|nr:hypothetical protein BST14_18970 [Mycobacterium arosiense ATCC BAA-1401 = DSM 45069]